MELEKKESIELSEEEASEKELQQAEKEVAEALVSEQGIAGDRFDTFPAPSLEETVAEEVDDREHITIHYGFQPEEIKTALQIFQKHTIYKKNLIYSLIIGILFFLYLYRIIQTGKAEGFYLFMCVMIVAAIAYIWYFPLAHIKNVVKAISKTEYQENFILKVYEDSIQAGEGSDQVTFPFAEGKLMVWETEEMFIVGHAKQRVFALPKRCIETAEECQKISEIFQKGLAEKYRFLSKK